MMTTLLEPFSPLFELSRELNRFAPSGTQLRAFIPAAVHAGQLPRHDRARHHEDRARDRELTGSAV